MKVTNIRVLQKINLGNYESFEFSADAVIDEEDNLSESTEKLTKYVDWYANRAARDGKARVYRLALADENTVTEKKEAAEKWLAVYDKRKAEVEGI